MYFHEYQAKELLKGYDIAFPLGMVAASSEEAKAAAQQIETGYWFVKAQILAGDRGKFGGVKVARSVTEVGTLARTLLGSKLVTPQTGAAGMSVDSVYVEKGCEIARELYLAVLLDQYRRELILIASSVGGTGIEELLQDSPQNLQKVHLSVDQPPAINVLHKVAQNIEIDDEMVPNFVQICLELHRAMGDLDALLIELNPLAITKNGELVCLDVKMEVDDNALYRHSEYQDLRNQGQTLDRKLRTQSGYNYVLLNGDVGLLVGGAGLALATMDLLKLHGCEPANFLDLPPIATRMVIADACRTIMQNNAVKALFVNVVGGGLTHCDTVAEGLVTAYREAPFNCPIVVRFAGTNKERGVVLLKNSNIPFHLARSMGEAVEILMRIM